MTVNLFYDKENIFCIQIKKLKENKLDSNVQPRMGQVQGRVSSQLGGLRLSVQPKENPMPLPPHWQCCCVINILRICHPVFYTNAWVSYTDLVSASTAEYTH